MTFAACQCEDGLLYHPSGIDQEPGTVGAASRTRSPDASALDTRPSAMSALLTASPRKGEAER